MSKQPSIRDQLENDAWRKHPKFAARWAGNRQTGHRRRPLRWEDRALLILSAVLLLLLIIRVETARAQSPDDELWGLEFQGGGGTQHAVAVNTEIRADVTGLIARIDVTQVFRNDGFGWAEAVYRFPLPDGSAVDRLRVEVGDRVIEGEIREKMDARRRYQQARDSGKVVSLVEQKKANQFETRLANIAPGKDIQISISFLSRVEFADGSFSLRIPMTFTPRWLPAGTHGISSPRFIDVAGTSNHFLTIEVDLRTGLNLTSLESRYHDIDIHPTLQGYHLFLADPDTRTDRVFELNWAPEFGSTPLSTLMTHDTGDAVYAMVMLAPPLAEAIDPQPREVVFIIDTSGSMEGTSIQQARAALRQGLEFLGPEDRFNLIEFNSKTHLLFPESVPAYPSYLAEAEDYIDGLRANGGTVMAPALRAAMSLPEQDLLLRQIIFVTDGSVGNEHELLLQIGDQLQESRLFTVSIGSAPNAWFMQKAAEIGRGSHTRIGKLEDVEERMSSLWARIENPAIQNICVDWGMEAEFYPEVIPDLYAGEPLWLHARLPHEPREVTVCGELEGRHWQAVSRELPGKGNDSIATLWARSKVEALEDSQIFGIDPNALRRQVLDLSLEFGLLTQYTSLIAVDRTPSRPENTSLESGEIPSLLPAGSTSAAGFSQTATGWLVQLILSFVSLLIAAGMLLYLPPSRFGSTRSPLASSTS